MTDLRLVLDVPADLHQRLDELALDFGVGLEAMALRLVELGVSAAERERDCDPVELRLLELEKESPGPARGALVV